MTQTINDPNNLSSFDIYIGKLIYGLTANNRINPINRVTVSSNILNAAKKEMEKKTNYSVNINNQTLVTYALLNLLDLNVQDTVAHRLMGKQKQKALVALLNLPKTSDQTQAKVTNQKLLNLEDKLDTNQVLLQGLVNSIGWLVLERNGLDQLGLANSTSEIYTKLRQDAVKPVIDEIIKAGLNEQDRQRHLDNL